MNRTALALYLVLAACAGQSAERAIMSATDEALQGMPADCRAIYSGTGGLHVTDIICPETERKIKAAMLASVECNGRAVTLKPGREGLHVDDYQCELKVQDPGL